MAAKSSATCCGKITFLKVGGAREKDDGLVFRGFDFVGGGSENEIFVEVLLKKLKKLPHFHPNILHNLHIVCFIDIFTDHISPKPSKCLGLIEGELPLIISTPVVGGYWRFNSLVGTEIQICFTSKKIGLDFFHEYRPNANFPRKKTLLLILRES